ncbi:MAG: hypothetical protein HXY20_15220 [Acidobacteria bacterium]|nr:hypothetical protein [Acidobacteriota bacterium]
MYSDEIKTVIAHTRWNKPELLQSLDTLFSNYTNAYRMSWNDLLPVLFITDRNPAQPYSSDSVRIFYMVPLGEVENEGYIREIVERIVYSLNTGDFEPLETLVAQRLGKRPINLLQAINQSVELKPNVAGLGINLNGIIDLFTRKSK